MLEDILAEHGLNKDLASAVAVDLRRRGYVVAEREYQVVERVGGSLTPVSQPMTSRAEAREIANRSDRYEVQRRMHRSTAWVFDR